MQWWGRFLLGVALAAALGPGAVGEAGHEDGKVLIFAQPLARADAIWMAQAKGFFKDEKLNVTVKWMSEGGEALRNFQDGKDGKQGAGDFVVVSELLAVNFWQSMDGGFAAIAALARDAEGYVGVARAEVKVPQDLKGKAIGTRLGSTNAWFLGEYLRAHGMSERDVALKNLSPDAILSWDLEGGDVAAFFVREPYAGRALTKYGDRVYRLAGAKGYIHGYMLLGTWKWYLRDHPGVAERLLRAIDKGRWYAAEHKDEVIRFAREMFSVEDTAPVEVDYGSNERVVGLDKVALDDFHNLGRWMTEAGIAKRKFDPQSFFDPHPLRAAVPERVAPEVHR